MHDLNKIDDAINDTTDPQKRAELLKQRELLEENLIKISGLVAEAKENFSHETGFDHTELEIEELMQD